MVYGFPKPIRGEFLAERKAKRQERVNAEKATMREARKRDGNVCRFPMCRHKSMPVDVAHMIHRGIGGNPAGDRTQTELLWTACRIHHGQYDAGLIDVQPQDSILGANGPMDFFARTESGTFEIFASEKRIGVSTIRSTK